MFQQKIQNIHDFNMITGINESVISANHISCKCKCKIAGKKCNSNQKWNNNKSRCKCKHIIYLKKILFGILLHVVGKIVNIYQVLLTIHWLLVMKS